MPAREREVAVGLRSPADSDRPADDAPPSDAPPDPAAAPRAVIYVTGRECPLCDRAVAAMEAVAAETPVRWEVRVIDEDPALALRFSLRVPVVEVDGREVLEGRVDAERLRAALARGREADLSDLAEVPDLEEATDAGEGGEGSGARSSTDRLSAALGFGPAPTEMAGPRAVSPRVPRRAFPSRPRPSAAGSPASAPDRVVAIPAGEFLYGRSLRRRIVPAFEIDRDPVSQADYHRFVAATGHRAPPYWRGSAPPAELRDHPVVGVDYVDALAYARWAGKDLPYDDEWERAARGVDGRSYPWGDEPDSCANTSRTGLAMTLPIGFHAKNVSPEGCRDMVGNVWEWTHSPVPDGGVVVRGGSWFDPPEHASAVSRFASRRDVRNGTLGFRCVRRPAPRDDVPPTLSAELVEAEIEGRRGVPPPAGEPPWIGGERDLVPDIPRLRALGAREGAVAGEADAEAPRRPGVKKAYFGVESAGGARSADDGVSAPRPPSRPPARREPERPLAISSSVGAPSEAATTSSALATSAAIDAGATGSPPRAAPIARAASAAPRERPAVRSAPRPRRRVPGTLLWLALVAAAAVGAFLLARGDRAKDPSSPAAQVGLPAPVAGPADALPPRVTDGAKDGAAPGAGIAQAILVFAGAASPASAETSALALDLHRRLRPWSGRVEVVLVLPRESVASPDDPEATAKALAALGVTGDLRVHLDPADPADPAGGGRARRALGLGEGTYALLARDGAEALRVSAGADLLTLAQVEPLVAAALAKAGPAD